MNGGFGFGNKGMGLKGKYKFKNVVKNTKKSEMNLMNTYEDMDSKIKKYNKAYSTHIENIKILDDYLNFNGIETLFKKVIMVDNFVKGHIDKENPLLFNNYKIEGELLPSEMRKAHLLTQVKFIMSKTISGSDQAFIKEIYVTDISKKEFVLVIVTIDNSKDKKIIPHTDYIVEKTKVKSFINEIISDTKKKLQRSSKIAYFNGNNHSIKLSKDSKNKSATKNKSSKKSKKNNNSYLTISTNKSKGSKSKGSKSKGSKSKGSKSKSRYTKKSEITSKLSEYMTDYEKIKKANRIKEEKQKAEDAAKAKAQAQGFKPITNNRRGDILGQEFKTQIQTGYQPMQQQYQQNNTERCKIHKDFSSCRNSNCWWEQNTQECTKKPERRNPPYNPNYGQYPQPNIGANPAQNPFTVQQQPYRPPEQLV